MLLKSNGFCRKELIMKMILSDESMHAFVVPVEGAF